MFLYPRMTSNSPYSCDNLTSPAVSTSCLKFKQQHCTFYTVLGTEPRALCVLGKHPMASELHTQLCVSCVELILYSRACGLGLWLMAGKQSSLLSLHCLYPHHQEPLKGIAHHSPNPQKPYLGCHASSSRPPRLAES